MPGWHRECAEAQSSKDGDFASEARSRPAGGATRSEPVGVGFKGRIIDPNCEFLGVVGWRKKENQSFESDGVEE